MADVDKDLVTALKQAASKPMYFSFIPKGGADGKLFVSKAKIPAKTLADAKKEIGGANPISGKCTGPLNGMEFQVKAAPPTMEAALKKVIKRDTGLGVVASVVLNANAESEDDGADAAAATAAPPAAADANGAAPAALNLDDWTVARTAAITDLKALAAKVAATKHETAAAVLGEIQSVIKNLPAAPKANQIDDIIKYVNTEEIIQAAEDMPADFHQLSIRKPLLAALQALKEQD